MQDYEAQFTSFLKKRGLKLTQQRRSVLEEVFSTHDHFQAEELRARLPKVSKATLYRTLALLVEARLLRAETFGERHAHYEHIFGHQHHDHLICITCGRIEEFRNEDIEQQQQRVSAEHNFTLTGHRVQLFGVCGSCTQKRK